jgi:hypothetical protein
MIKDFFQHNESMESERFINRLATSRADFLQPFALRKMVYDKIVLKKSQMLSAQKQKVQKAK